MVVDEYIIKKHFSNTLCFPYLCVSTVSKFGCEFGASPQSSCALRWDTRERTFWDPCSTPNTPTAYFCRISHNTWNPSVYWLVRRGIGIPVWQVSLPTQDKTREFGIHQWCYMVPEVLKKKEEKIDIFEESQWVCSQVRVVLQKYYVCDFNCERFRKHSFFRDKHKKNVSIAYFSLYYPM